MTKEEILKAAKPILFNTEMVKAILSGRKTQTRRVIKRKYNNTHIETRHDKYGDNIIEFQNEVEGETYGKNPDGTSWYKVIWKRDLVPKYKNGDILYVRETWTKSPDERYYYKADKLCLGYDQSECECVPNNIGHLVICELCERLDGIQNVKWKPSIHMPKEATRIFLRITNVKAERLQDISETDAISEGSLMSDLCETPEYRYARKKAIENGTKPPLGYSPKERFKVLWDSTIKKSDLDKYGWDANPWVWVYEFERMEI